jgi:DNA-binding MarR family transcriptional regulator
MQSSGARDALIEQILDHLQLLGPEIERVGGAAASSLSLNRTDLRALRALMPSEGMTAGELARALHVTTGATTRVIDSLVASGHAVREPDPHDRRRVLVRLTPEAAAAVHGLFQRLREQGRTLLQEYGDVELEILARFLADARSLFRLHALRLERLTGGRHPHSPLDESGPVSPSW